jgi:glycosyltransferase involved in cell wall biosynthesis
VPGLWLDHARFLRQERPDHVIHTNWQHLLVLRPFPNANRDWLWLHEVVPDKPQYRLVFQLLARRLRGFIAVSHAVKDALLGIGISAYQVRVIHNGLEDPYGVEHERVEPWDGARIGIVGQVAPWKGHQDLLEAFGMLAIKHSNVDLHVYGDDSSAFAQMLKRRSEELRISNRIVWHGFVPGRNDIYRKMDICIVPSTGADPLPTTAIEAGFFGLPVVASRVGGMSEIVDEGETGFLVDAGNTKQLAARINELLENPNLRKKMGWRARQRVQQRFSRDRFVAQFSQSMAEGTCLG